jgi:hypothetical protein
MHPSDVPARIIEKHSIQHDQRGNQEIESEVHMQYELINRLTMWIHHILLPIYHTA